MEMEDKLNIMLFSDHGMTKIQWMEKVIELDKYISMSTIAKMMDRGPVVSLWPKENKYNEVSLIQLKRFVLASQSLLSVRTNKTQITQIYHISTKEEFLQWPLDGLTKD